MGASRALSTTVAGVGDTSSAIGRAARIPTARRPAPTVRRPLAVSPAVVAEPETEAVLRTDAKRNLEQVLRAAREVFTELGYDASIEEVARRAGVGVGTIYRRFTSRESLVQRILASEPNRLAIEAEDAAAEEPDAWSALARFLRRACASGAGRLIPVLAGQVTPTDDITRARTRLSDVLDRLVEQAARDGDLRDDVSAADITLLLACLIPPPGLTPPQNVTMSGRYLEIALDGLRADHASPLPGRAFGRNDMQDLFRR